MAMVSLANSESIVPCSSITSFRSNIVQECAFALKTTPFSRCCEEECDEFIGGL